jgi:hypothetical protein
VLRERGTVWWGVGWACDGCGGGGREVEDEDGGREVIGTREGLLVSGHLGGGCLVGF